VFARLQRSGCERFEARLAMAALVSRVVGVHRLLLVNFYPFLQRYLQPHQRDVTQLLAALVQARPARWARRAVPGFRRMCPGEAVLRQRRWRPAWLACTGRSAPARSSAACS